MTDNVNHPAHYEAGWSNGAEVIDITENLNFNRGNAVKYIARAGKKDPAKELEDLRKAQWYLNREIDRLESPWSLDKVQRGLDEVAALNVERMRSFGRYQRQWDRLDHVPPQTIVADKDGDQYRRIQGTSKFLIRFWSEEYGFGDWREVPPFVYYEQEIYGPYKEVVDE